MDCGGIKQQVEVTHAAQGRLPVYCGHGASNPVTFSWESNTPGATPLTRPKTRYRGFFCFPASLKQVCVCVSLLRRAPRYVHVPALRLPPVGLLVEKPKEEPPVPTPPNPGTPP